MSRLLFITIAVVVATASLRPQVAMAADRLLITIPKRSELTPVQRLNREGVESVKSRKYEKAAALFYKAYLYDPSDPFTLNNLGYVSELQGELDRALKFYSLASEQGSNASIDRSNAKKLEGKPMRYALAGLQDLPMRVNRMNVDAMSLLAEDRGFEAVSLLQKALLLDPQNPFTMNNLGVADEALGDYDGALRNYGAVVESHSMEPAVVTLDRSWRGKPVSSMAADSARRLEQRIRKTGSAGSQAVMFTIRGVSAANRNDWAEARQDFLRAYALDPGSAFCINNRGYVAERDGDLETAQFFYGKARKGDDSTARVGLATQQSAQGKRLVAVANDSNHLVDGALDKYSQDRRKQAGPIELTPRGNPPNGSSGEHSEAPSSTDVPPLVDQTVPQLN